MTTASLSTTRFSVAIDGEKISLSLERECWVMLGEIAAEKHTSRAALVSRISRFRMSASLSSDVRAYLLRHYRQKAGLSPVAEAR